MIRVLNKFFLSFLAILLVFSFRTDALAEVPSLKTLVAPETVPSVEAPSTTATSLHQWLLDRMLSWMPPGRSFIPSAKESKEDGSSRYGEIADSMIEVAYDPSEKPLFGGKYGRAQTLALVASMSWFESGYRKDVDLGLGKLGRGDSGRSWCMMQILLGTPNADGETKKRVYLTADGFKFVYPKDPLWDKAYSGKDLVQDRRKCFRTGLHFARISFRACSRLPVGDRLGVYGAGKCIPGWKPSRYRVRKAQKWLSTSKPPLTDIEAMKLLHPKETPENSDKKQPVPVSPVSILHFQTRFGPKEPV